jgi:uncharacterized protein DUF6350
MDDTPTRRQIPHEQRPGGDDGRTMSLLERVRPAWSAPTLSQPRTSAYLPGALAGLRAAGISFAIITVPLLAAWALASDVTAGWLQAFRLAADGWLLVHHVTVAYPGGHLGLVPLGLALVPVLAVYRSARRLADQPLLSQGFSSVTVNIRPSVQAVVGLALAYAGAATLVALLVGTGEARPVIWQAPLGPGLLALLAGSVGIVSGHPRSAGLRGELAGWLPPRVRSTLRPAALAAVIVLAAGCLLVLLAVATNGDRVLALHRALRPGGFGGVLLVAGQVGYLPDLAAWGVSWLAGPGFALGTGSVVAPGTVHLGLLPVVPVLGALPAEPLPATWALLAPTAVPVLAGAVTGWWSVRRAPAHDLGVVSRLLDAVGAVVLAAFVLGLVVLLSAGPIGPGRLAHVGANALVVVPFLAMELAAGAVPVAAASSWWRRRRTGPAPVAVATAEAPADVPAVPIAQWPSSVD